MSYPTGSSTGNAYEDVRRENHRLTLQVRRLQDVISAMRDEIADANAEIVASKRLFDEQKSVLMQELHRERHWREESQRELRGKPKISVGTNTLSEASTSTVASVGTSATPGVGLSVAAGYGVGDSSYGATAPYDHPANSRYFGGEYEADLSTTPSGTRGPQNGSKSIGKAETATGMDDAHHPTLASGAVPVMPFHYRQMIPPSFGREKVLQEFADGLCRRAQYYDRDLYAIFKELGATNVDEVCANLTELDLTSRGVPTLKARTLMHLIMDHTANLLQQSGAL